MKKKFYLLSALAMLMLFSMQQTNAQDKIAASTGWKLTGNTGTDVNANFVGNIDNKGLSFRTNNLNRMRILKTGEIGIGTINPTAQLGIVGTKNVSLSSPGYLMLGDSASYNMAVDYNVIQSRFNGAAAGLYLNYYGGTTYVGPSAAFQVTGTATTLASGNFNIGTSTQSIQFANPSGTPAAMMYMLASGTSNIPRMVLAHSPSFPTWGLQYSDATDQFDFLGGGTSRMSVNLANGNVGIGVVSPVYKLEVCGTIRAKEVRVETGWCDYVFEKNYKLRSIDELENYINANKHLPGIAPASEVEKDGLKVAEMNKAMMEKIEELTLYVIRLSKDNKQLHAEIDALKK